MKERNTTRTVVLNVVGLTARLIGDSTPHLRAFFERHPSAAVKPVLPAVTCSAQATYLTGLPPSQHGVVANGWYNRELAEHHFWKQSNHLVQGEKIWETLRRETPGFTCAKLFWWFNMYSSADYSITPRPMYPADGRKVFDVYSSPPSIRDQIKRDLGEFPFPTFWGPMAGIASSRWIADSAKWIEERHQPSLSLVYLPHLDYNLQRLGLDLPAVAGDLTAIDDIVGDLLTFFEGKGCQVILISEYGITSVDQPVYLNRVFRQHGWIAVKDELGREILDLGASRACAIADHQAAHVYVNDPSILEQVGNVLRHTPGVERVLDKSALRAEGLDHERAGDFVVLADPAVGSRITIGRTTPRLRTLPVVSISTASPASIRSSFSSIQTSAPPRPKRLFASCKRSSASAC
jgi:predicted AlkP superfamily pyrophosphatase or phosphodiesterase